VNNSVLSQLHRNSSASFPLLLVLCIMLSACANAVDDEFDRPLFQSLLGPGNESRRQAGNRTTIIDGSNGRRTEVREIVEPGTGSFLTSSINEATAGGPPLSGPPVRANFVNTDLQEFVRALFNDIFKVNYVIDPGVAGSITIRTTKAIERNELLRLARDALAANGAMLQYRDGIYRVSARQGGQAQSVRVIKVEHVSASRLAQVLKPVAPGGMDLIADDQTGALVIKGGGPDDVAAVRSMVRSFDTDQMSGMSFALLPLRNMPAGTVVSEIDQILSSSGQTGTRIIPIARMNALVVVARKSSHIKTVQKWVRRLDQQDRTSLRSYIYAVQNRRAAELAKVLNDAFLAPRHGEQKQAPGPIPANAGRSVIPALTEAADQNRALAPAVRAQETSQAEQPRITADSSTNSLIIYATPEQFKSIRAAIHRLDIVPLQVLIEATIAEVRLNKNLRYGIRWFLRDKNIGVGFTDDPGGGYDTEAPGFNFVVSGPNGRLVLSALENETDVEIISSPSLTVLDNQTAKLQVGDQVPIATRSSTSVDADNAPVVNTIDLKDTGIILSVTPRVNASGVVVLDIVQEASDVVPTTTSEIDSPTIRQRKIESSVAVSNGSSVILGGLISRRADATRSGVPIVKDIPVLGNLFKRQLREKDRTELLIIIRPVVIRSDKDFRSIAEEFEYKMRGLSNVRYQ